MSTIKTTYRTCSVCGVPENEIEFQPKYRQCKPCYSAKTVARTRAYYQKNKDKMKKDAARYYEEHREEINARRRSSNGTSETLERRREHYRKNAERIKEYRREYAKRDYVRERIREARRDYYATLHGKHVIGSARTRRRKAAGEVFDIAPKDLRRLYEASCVGCGSDEVTLDHIVPVIKGGHTSVGNLQPLCRSCNASKGSSLLIEWRARRKVAA